jgi:glycosyltransferase involved in cell wall biosynthesis
MSQTKPINVIHIASGDSWAGAEVQLYTLAKALYSFDDVSVRIILLNHGELESRLQAAGVSVTVLDETRLNGIQIFWRIRQLLKQWRPDIVHTHRLKENILGGLAARFAGNIPSLRTVHGAPEHWPGWRKPHKKFIYGLNHKIGKYLQCKIVSVSDELAELLKFDFPSRAIEVIENGIDIEAMSPIAKDADPPVNPDTPAKVGIVGRLVPVKRVDLFIKLAGYMKQHYHERAVHFHIYGDGPLREELERLVAELDLEDCVTFEGHCNNIHQEMASLDALIIISDHEGLPMNLLEAMVLGIPVIAHSIGGIPKVLGYDKYGYLVNSQDIPDYGSRLIEVLDNPETVKPLVAAARKHISDSYSAESNANHYRNLYRHILSNDNSL